MDPFEQLLLGPTYATAKVLAKMGLTLQDMDVVEVSGWVGGGGVWRVWGGGWDDDARVRMSF